MYMIWLLGLIDKKLLKGPISCMYEANYYSPIRCPEWEGMDDS